jgi:hypothetical protein
MWCAWVDSEIAGSGRGGGSYEKEYFHSREEAEKHILGLLLGLIEDHIKDNVCTGESFITLEDAKKVDTNNLLDDKCFTKEYKMDLKWTSGTTVNDAAELTELIFDDILDIIWYIGYDTED